MDAATAEVWSSEILSKQQKWTTHIEISEKSLLWQCDISVLYGILFPKFPPFPPHWLIMHGCPFPSWNLKHFTSVLFLARASPSLQVFVNCFPKRPIHYKHVCNIHLGWRLSPCQRLYIIQASCLATIAYHLALSMSVTASSANNIGSEPLNADELKTCIARNWDLQTNAGWGKTHSGWQKDWSLE